MTESNPFIERAIRAVQPLLDSLEEALEAVRVELEGLSELESLLRRPERQIAVVGWFNTGKSSLLNALIGAPLVPARAGMPTRSVVRLMYGAEPTAMVRRDGDREMVVSFDGATELAADPEVEEVRLEVPLPLARTGWVLVDTPGLGRDEELSQRSYREIARSDLVIVVLAADKILSVRERELIGHIHRQLHGNVICVVNRMDTVDEEERAEVLEWAASALRDIGNRLVGTPRIFGTSARLSAPDEGVTACVRWLETVIGTALGERMVALSRLGVAERTLEGLVDFIGEQQATAARRAADLRREHEVSGARERAERRAVIVQSRNWLRTYRGSLGMAGARFVEECLTEMERQLDGATPGAASLALPYEAAMERYVATITEEVWSALLPAAVTVPPFEAPNWVLQAEVEAAKHPTTEMATNFGSMVDRLAESGTVARDRGENLGRWLEKNVFGLDARRETMARAEQAAHRALLALEREAERYLDRVDGLLTQADEYFERWSPGNSALEEAEREEVLYASLAIKCEEALSEIHSLGELLLAA